MGSDIRRVFGSAVRRRRRHLGLSQDELAERAGIDRTYVSGVENGSRNPSLLSQQKIATALNVDLADLLRTPDDRS